MSESEKGRELKEAQDRVTIAAMKLQQATREMAEAQRMLKKLEEN